MTTAFEKAWQKLEKAAYDSTDRGYMDDPQNPQEMTPEQLARAKAKEQDDFTQMLDEMPEFDEDMMQQRLMNMPREQLMALVSRMTQEKEMRR